LIFGIGLPLAVPSFALSGALAPKRTQTNARRGGCQINGAGLAGPVDLKNYLMCTRTFFRRTLISAESD
jgi:hypothetical protein